MSVSNLVGIHTVTLDTTVMLTLLTPDVGRLLETNLCNIVT